MSSENGLIKSYHGYIYAEYVKRHLWHRMSDTDKNMTDLIEDHVIGKR